MSDILQAVDVHKSYRVGASRLEVLRGASLAVREGELLAVVGASGTGKSTLLHLLGALDEPDSGQILLRGENVSSFPRSRQDAVRNRTVGFVFQFYYLLPEFNALENVLMPAMVGRSVLGWMRSRGKVRRKAVELLDRLGLKDRMTHRPGQLSGGEQQRVAIARALINDPPILLCDEPTGNLDEATSVEIVGALWTLSRDTSLTTVVVTHNMDLARRAHRIVRLTEGRVEPVQDAPGAGGPSVKP